MRKTRTLKDRRDLYNEVSIKSRQWAEMSDSELLSEVRRHFPCVSEKTTPIECLRTLMMYAFEPITN